MRAKIKENLLDVIDDFFDGKEGHRTDPEFLKLCNRIAGKEVDLVFIAEDAFEKEDKSYWLPDCCWDEIKSETDRGSGGFGHTGMQ
jgi:hypothetical protein